MSNGDVAAAAFLRRAITRVLHRIGRRGASLAFVGLLCLVIAASLEFAPATQRAAPGYTTLAAVAPLTVWAVVWCVTGVLCLVQMFMRSDRMAFAAATALLLLYGLVYLVSTFTGENPRGWVGGAVWLAFGGWIALIATWPEAVTVDPLPSAQPMGTTAVVVADAAGIIQSWNPQAAALFGWSTEEAVGRPLTMLMPQRFRDQHSAGLGRVRTSSRSKLAGRIIPLVGLRRDGSEFPIALTINAWHSDEGIAYTGVIRLVGGSDVDPY
ncbi:PAS domain S-box protein [Nonomuraea sp. NPDC050643]|uniref:PAS domain S-box protein n=1 Tax=Nonomuraea sp. NPDC050643 TaxID=3155660 RepID=UPI003411061C